MNWRIGITEGKEKWEIQVPAKLSEKQLVKQHIQRQHPKAVIVYMTHDSEIDPEKREKSVF